MSVILSKINSEDGNQESSFQIFDTSTFNVVYRHHEESGSYFEHEIMLFGMLYKTHRFAIVFSNKPNQ